MTKVLRFITEHDDKLLYLQLKNLYNKLTYEESSEVEKQNKKDC